MVAGLKWAHRYRLELAIEIAQIENGLRRVMQNTASGTVDISDQILSNAKDRFEQLEEMISALGSRPLDQ